MKPLLIQANAKLNLDLKIVGKRADGYHLIESTFQSIDLSDFLLFGKSRKNSLTEAIICPEIKNLEKYFSKFKLKLKMSGSGPTTFCGVNSYSLAKKIVENYSDFNGDIFICRPQKEALKTIWKTL